MGIINRIQSQSLTVKKTILWGVVIVISLVLFFIWMGNAKKTIQNMSASSFLEITPPPIDLPQITEPEVTIPPELEKQLEELEKQNNEENTTK